MYSGFKTSIEIGAVDTASPVLNTVEKNVKKVSETVEGSAASFKNLAGAFTALVVAKHIIGVIQSVVKPATDMQLAMKNLGFQTGVVGEKLDEMRRKAEYAAEITTYGPQQSVEVMLQLARATGSADAAMSSLAQTLGLAQASFGKLTPEKAAEMVGTMVKAFGIGADQIKGATDKIAALSKAMGVGLEEFKDVMGSMGLAALRGGQSFDTLISMFALARRVLPNSRRAATEILRAMSEITKGKAVGAFGDIGVSVMDATGRIRDFGQIMLELATKYTSAPIIVRDAINNAFGEAAAKPIIAMISQLTIGIDTMTEKGLYGSQVLDYMNGVLSTSSGAVKQLSDAYMETASAAFQQLSEAWDGIKRAIGDALLPALRALATNITAIIHVVTSFIKLPVVNFLAGIVIKAVALIAGAHALRLAFHGLSTIFKATSAWLVQITMSTTALTAATTAFTAATAAGATATRAATEAVKAFVKAAATNPFLWVPMILPYIIKLYDYLKKLKGEHHKKIGLENLTKNKAFQNILKMTDPARAEKAFAAWKKGLPKAWGPEGDEIRKAMLKGAQLSFDKHMEIEKFKIKMDQKRFQIAEETAQKMRNALIIGSEPFVNAVDEMLKSSTKYKPKAVDINAFLSMQTLLESIQKNRGKIYKGTFIKPDIADEAVGGMKQWTVALGYFKKIVKGEKIKGPEAITAVKALEDAITPIMSVNTKIGEKLVKSTLVPLLHSMTPAGRSRAMRSLRLSGGMGHLGRILQDYFPGAGMFASSPAAAKAEMAGRPTNLPFDLGGRQGTRGQNLSPGQASTMHFGPEYEHLPTRSGGLIAAPEMPAVARKQSVAERELVEMRKKLDEMQKDFKKVAGIAERVEAHGIATERKHDKGEIPTIGADMSLGEK